MAGATTPTQRVEVLEAAAFRTDRDLSGIRDELRVIEETLVEIKEDGDDIKGRLTLLNDRLDQVNQGYLEIRDGLAGVKRSQNMMLGMIRTIGNKLDAQMPEGDPE